MQMARKNQLVKFKWSELIVASFPTPILYCQVTQVCTVNLLSKSLQPKMKTLTLHKHGSHMKGT